MYIVVLLTYSFYMTNISITEARADLAAVIKRAKNNPIQLTSHGKPQAILIDPSLYEPYLKFVNGASRFYWENTDMLERMASQGAGRMADNHLR